jgi:hypothetical protein
VACASAPPSGTIADKRAHQPLRGASAGHDAYLDLWLAEARRLASDDQVARQRKFTAATQGVTFDGGDKYLAAAPHDLEYLVGGVQRMLGGRHRRHFGDIGTCHEILPGAVQNDDPDGRVGVQGDERRAQFGLEREVKRIASLGPIQRQ